MFGLHYPHHFHQIYKAMPLFQIYKAMAPVPLLVAHKPTDFMEYMILDLICLVVSFETVYYTPKTDIYSSSYGFRNIYEI